MCKIGEFSKLTQVSIRMLRYYDETGLLKPTQIDQFSGYRFYSVEQIPTLHKIIFLRDLGYSVAEIAMTINNWKKDYILTQFKHKQLEIQNTIKQEQEKLKKLETALNSIDEEEISIRYNFAIKKIPSYPVISLRRIIANYFSEGLLWKELYEFVEQYWKNSSQQWRNIHRT